VSAPIPVIPELPAMGDGALVNVKQTGAASGPFMGSVKPANVTGASSL